MHEFSAAAILGLQYCRACRSFHVRQMTMLVATHGYKLIC